MKLHLGVIELPYVDVATPSAKGAAAAASTVNTADVARWLEEDYHVMEVFYELHKQEIADALALSMNDSLQNFMLGAKVPENPLLQAESTIEMLFRKFIEMQEMDSLGIPGVPTQASLDGVNHRFKSGYQKGSRPSFRDTGLYESSFKAWFDANRS